MNKPRRIYFHTIDKPGLTPWEEVRRWHTLPKPPEGQKPVPGKHGRGWSDVGYHRYIRKDGTIERGREDHVVGAGVGGHNTGSLHYALEGDGDTERWTGAQERAFFELCRQDCEKYGIPISEIRGHREAPVDVGGKTCPGKLVDCDAVRVKLRAYFTLKKVPILSPE